MRPVIAIALAASIALAACGSDEESGSGSGAPQKVTITATGTERAPKFQVTGSAKAGAATIELQNDLEEGEVDGQLVYLAEEHSDEEVVAELGKAMRGKPVADWFQGGGGPGGAGAGETASVTQELRAGTYLVAAGEGEPALPLAKIEVSDEAGPELEPPAATISATEYAFEGKAVKSGEPVLLENAGGEWHHFLASKLKPDATLPDVRKFLETEEGEPPFSDEENGLESTVLEGGASQVIDFDAEPGRYAIFCFIADKRGGPPHVAKGMVSEIQVE